MIRPHTIPGALCLWLAVATTLFGTRLAGNPPESTASQRLQLGQAAYDRGDINEALRQWQRAHELFVAQRNLRGQINVLINLGAAYQALGQQRLALQSLEEAARLADNSPDRSSLLMTRNGLGVACGCLGQFQRATPMLRDALAAARAQDDTGMVIVLSNNLGYLLAAQNKTNEAAAAFREAAHLARQSGQPLLAARACANLAAMAARDGDADNAGNHNRTALDALAAVPPGHDQALLYLRCGRTDWQRRQLTAAEHSYQRALAIAEPLDDKIAMSYALGYLGELRAAEGRNAEAMDLTRRAAFVAQEIQLLDALYRWEWQTARLHCAAGDRHAARAAYRRAIETLQPIRHDLVGATFRESVAPVFYELTDLLLQEGDSPSVLREACEIIEQLKSLEIEDYLQDECMILARSKMTRIENVGQQTAILYVIPLADRTELIVGIGSDWQRVRVPVGAERLSAEVRAFRSHLQKRTTNEYLAEARQLYQWLIAPLRRRLDAAGVTTLVFVPDGALRTIPLAALQDGERFLIEHYAIAVSPGLTLLEPRPFPRSRVAVLQAGLSEAVQNHSPLPNVPAELQAVQKVFGGTPLLDKKFVWPSLKKHFADTQYQLVHFATHGQISSDASASYILTYDGRLSLDQLEELIRPGQFRGRPVELLTLSACDTAVGDDRAALGLAGIALKAGARSALATLWSAHDESTAVLMGEFYAQLAAATAITKARAIQLAQIKTLRDPRFEHPSYWSPYLIIGNWL